MVANGKLAGLPRPDLVIAWKRVDLPTLARPTYRKLDHHNLQSATKMKSRKEIFRDVRDYIGEEKKEAGRGRRKFIAGGVLLTYDTTLQVVAGAAQEDLFLDGGFLGGHFGFLLLAGGEAAEVEREEGRRSRSRDKWRGRREAQRRETRYQRRTSCRPGANNKHGERRRAGGPVLGQLVSISGILCAKK